MSKNGLVRHSDIEELNWILKSKRGHSQMSKYWTWVSQTWSWTDGCNTYMICTSVRNIGWILAEVNGRLYRGRNVAPTHDTSCKIWDRLDVPYFKNHGVREPCHMCFFDGLIQIPFLMLWCVMLEWYSCVGPGLFGAKKSNKMFKEVTISKVMIPDVYKWTCGM